MRGAGELLNQWVRAGSGVNAREFFCQTAQSVAQLEPAVGADARGAVRVGEDLCLATTARDHADLADDSLIWGVQRERHVVLRPCVRPVQAFADVARVLD